MTRDDLGRMYGVGLMAFILFLSTMVGVPVLPQLSKELGADAAGVPIVVSAALATVVLAQFFTGVLAETYLLCFVYATEAFEQRHMGTSMGAFDSVMDLSLFIGPLMAVSIYKSTGQMAPVFLLAVAPAALALFATALWLPQSETANVKRET